MFIKISFSRNAVDYAGARILGDSVLDTATITSLRDLFFDTQFIEHGKFTDLHKIVVNIRHDTIEDELQRSTAALDTVDITRRSPLSWATQKGDAEAVRLLLEHGADPNNSDNTNMTPLHYAAQAKTPECLLLLIKHGARITQQTRGWTALHYACTFHDDLAYIRPLLKHGVDINKRTYVGKTALSLSILQNHLKSASYLIDIGADLNIPDNDNQSPLAPSIKFRRCEAMKLLLRAGAGHKPLSSDEGDDDTLLHLVAKFPDREIIEYLSHVDDLDLWGNVDVDARNSDGFTARECVRMHDSDAGIALEFQNLVMRVSGAVRDWVGGRRSEVGGQDDGDSDSSTEVFEDAVG